MTNVRRETSNEIRTQIINAYESGFSPVDISRIFSINRSTIYSIIKIYIREGRNTKKNRGAKK